MEIVSLSDECAALILTEDIYEIIIKASTLNELAQMLKKLSHSSPGFNYKFLPFMSPATALLFGDVHGQDSYAQLWLINYRVKLGISAQ